MSKLVLFLPDGTTLDVPLSRERTSIGRRADNDICLPNLAVSGEHAAVVTILADSFLEDLNSTNGTLVNGEPIAKHFLRDRDEIEIGRHKLVYCVDDDADPASKKLTGMARVHERDFGGRVETAKPFVRGQGAKKAAAAAPAELQGRRPREGGDPASSGTSRNVGARAKTGAQVRPQIEPLIDPPEPSLEETQPVVARPPLPVDGPAVKILTGARAGTAIALSKAETTLGRPGVQVAAIIQVDGRFRLKPIEGISPPAVNGQPIAADGADLAPGDVIEVAGGRVEFVDPTVRPVERDQTV
jgi:hypothetical protein